MALDLWAVSRMIEIEWRMCGGGGSDTLGIRKINEPTSPRHGNIPIPPMMDTQLDQIVITQVLEPLKEHFVDQFEAKISPVKPEDWFEIYLAAFVMLNHVERLARHSSFHAMLHSLPVSAFRISQDGEDPANPKTIV